MATALETYRQRKDELLAQITEQKTQPNTMLFLQEVNYRICVLETFQLFLKTAPITTDVKQMVFHYQMLDAYVRFIESERKFGAATDAEGKKKRETAAATLDSVAQDNRKRFASFHATAPEQYKGAISTLIGTVLPVWVQLRDTYIKI